MICFHCPIESNEHLLSWVNRIHLLSGNNAFKHTANLIGIENTPLKGCNHNAAFKKGITLLQKRLAQASAAFDEHTPFALWSLSFSKSEYVDWRTNNEDLNFRCFSPTALAFRTTWKYCNDCVRHDIKQCGHSFWHVKHQLPSVTHCYIHKSLLVSDDKQLLDLRQATLPQAYSFEGSAIQDKSLLLDWSLFVLEIFERLNRNCEFGETLKIRIRHYLSLPAAINSKKDNVVFKPIEKQFNNEMPIELLQHLFLFYINQYERPRTIIESTLGYSLYYRPKHPIYWLIILYWLKDKISLDDE